MRSTRHPCGLPSCQLPVSHTSSLLRKWRVAGGPIPGPATVRAVSADATHTASQQQEGQQLAVTDGAATVGAAALSRRRRRTRTSSTAASEQQAADQQKHKQQPKQQKPPQAQRQRVELHQLFAQQQPLLGSTRVTPASGDAVLPEGALADPNKALNPPARRESAGRPRRTWQQEQQQQHEQHDPQLQELVAQFQPFARSLQKVAQRQKQQQLQQLPCADSSGLSSGGASMLQEDTAGRRQQRREQHIRSRTSTLIELFGVQQKPDSMRRLYPDSVDTLAAQPEAAKDAAQRLARMLMQQQQQARKLEQQAATEAAEAAAEAAAGEVTFNPDAATAAKPSRASGSTLPQGTTRVYVPAPSIQQASSAAERQPLRLLSIKQQEQLRKEARAEAIRKVRERTVHDYQASLDSIINWQPSGQTLYIPDAPRHLPVAVQLTWQQHSSSATGSTAAAGEDAATPAASAARQLTHAEQQTLQQISSVVQQQLGHPLPDRAFVGERSFLLSSLAAAAVSERLKRWVGCCSKAYVSQLMTKEPCLLGQEPQVLLKTLEALNQQLQMPTEQCVAFALKYVVVVGLDAAELAARVEGLRDACGYDWEQAVKLVTAAPELLVVHPSSLKERMQALAQLLPEAAPKLPRVVLKSPFLLVRSPRAVARLIQELAEALGLSAWAASRLVAGQPGMLRNNYGTLQKRLERLQSLTSATWRWHRQLQALSPSALARCLTCPDMALDRLALLKDVGAAGSVQLPSVHLILTMPEVHFQDLLAKTAERQLRREGKLARDEELQLSTSSAEEEEEQQQQQQQRGERGAGSSSSSSGGQKLNGLNGSSSDGGRAKQLLAAVGIRKSSSSSGGISRNTGGASAGKEGKAAAAAAVAVAAAAEVQQSQGEDEGSVEGVLCSDQAWRSSLADVLQKTADELKQVVVRVGSGNVAGKVSASAGSSSSRSRMHGVK